MKFSVLTISQVKQFCSHPYISAMCMQGQSPALRKYKVQVVVGILFKTAALYVVAGANTASVWTDCNLKITLLNSNGV